jgi:hypothetical protein
MSGPSRRHRLRVVGPRVEKVADVQVLPLEYPRDIQRPKTRADCENLPRPCPFISCQFHLYLDVTTKGHIRFNFPDLEPHELVETCVLDVADMGQHADSDVADLMNMTRQGVLDVELLALSRLQRSLPRLVEGVR